MWKNKKFVYQVGNNKKVILWWTANQISTFLFASVIYLQIYKAMITFCKLECREWKRSLTILGYHPSVYLETVNKTPKSSVRKVNDDDYVKMERLYIWYGCWTRNTYGIYMKSLEKWLYGRPRDRRIKLLLRLALCKLAVRTEDWWY